MSHRSPNHSAAPHGRGALLDHERLDVYQLALEFHAQAMQMVPQRGVRHIRDQLERASLGVVLCIAEGAGRSGAKDKRRFYAMARGSTTECAAILDILRVRGIASPEACRRTRAMGVRLVQMLSRLCAPR